MTKAHTKCYFLIFDKSHYYQKTDKSKHYSEDNAIVTSRPEFLGKINPKNLRELFETKI